MSKKNNKTIIFLATAIGLLFFTVFLSKYNVEFVPLIVVDIPAMKKIAYTSKEKDLVPTNICNSTLFSPTSYVFSHTDGERYVNPSTQTAPIPNSIDCTFPKVENNLAELTYQECIKPEHLNLVQHQSGVGTDKNISAEFLSAGPFQQSITKNDGTVQSQVGCEWKYRIRKDNAKGVSIVRWIRQENGTTIHPIVIQYDVDTSKPEITDLKKSLISFIVLSL